MLEEWIMAAIMRNLPKQITKDLAMERTKANSIELQNAINIYMHDHQTGMPRNMPGPMLCMAEPDKQDVKPEESNNKEDTSKAIGDEYGKGKDANKDNWDLNAASKGGKAGGKGNGKKGYGECWHCGEWGHPRRECPHLVGQQASNGTLSALKGGKNNGWKGKGRKGKGGKGYGYKGKGKGYKGVYNNNSYRYPGKGVGKGLN